MGCDLCGPIARQTDAVHVAACDIKTSTVTEDGVLAVAVTVANDSEDAASADVAVFVDPAGGGTAEAGKTVGMYVPPGSQTRATVSADYSDVGQAIASAGGDSGADQDLDVTVAVTDASFVGGVQQTSNPTGSGW